MNIRDCCGRASKVIDSRAYKSGFTRRRRLCLACGRRWSTAEFVCAAHPGKGVRAVLLSASELRMVEAFRAGTKGGP